jgi:EpsD family peptidyl-prolyl cis-trans isomerase
MLRPSLTARRAAVLAALVVLSSCHGGKPTGQVVAKVDGQEITAAELRLEMAQIPPDPSNPSATQQRALQRIIARKLLAREADKRKLGETPAGKQLSERAREVTLVQLLQAKLGDTPLDTSDTAVQKFIQAHPNQFAQRQLIQADQIVATSGGAALAAQLQGMTSFPEVEAALSARHIDYVSSATVLDTAQLPSAEVDRVVALKPDSIHVGPGGGDAVRIVRIGSSRTEPLTGDAARDAAVRLMQFEHSQVARAAVQKILDNGKSRVWIDPGFAKS